MIGNTLQRMIFGELVRVFLFALISLTGMFLLAGVVQEASQRGLTPSQIFVALPLLIPNSLPYTVPATTLFAACVVYGRMAHDNEITALRSAGVHLGRLLLPGLAFGILTSGITFALYYDFIPRSQQRLADRMLEDIDELLLSVLKKQGCLRSPKLPYAMYVREIRGKELIDPIFKRRRDDGGYSLVAHAKHATLWTDVAADRVYVFMPSCSVVGDEREEATVRDQRFDMPLPFSVFKDSRIRPSKMGWQEINKKWDELLAEQPQRQTELADLDEKLAHQLLPPEHLAARRRELRFHETETQMAFRGFAAELNIRPALSLGGLAFVLVAFPVGIWFHRADYLSTFVGCFLPIVFVYYPLVLCGTNLARDGRLPAYIAVWLADAVALVVGAIMLRKLFRQ